MSTPAPFGPAPPGAPDVATGPAAGPPPGRRGRRLAILTVAAGLVGLLAAGGGAYAAVHAAKSGIGPEQCGGIECIPTLKSEQVITALEEQGYECEREQPTRCGLRIGFVAYTAYVTDHDGQISRVWVQVTMPRGAEVSPSMMAYLTWFASLPFGDDPAFLAELKSWLTERIKDGKNAKASIGGYRYRLEFAKDHPLSLYIQGT